MKCLCNPNLYRYTTQPKPTGQWEVTAAILAAPKSPADLLHLRVALKPGTSGDRWAMLVDGGSDNIGTIVAIEKLVAGSTTTFQLPPICGLPVTSSVGVVCSSSGSEVVQASAEEILVTALLRLHCSA